MVLTFSFYLIIIISLQKLRLYKNNDVILQIIYNGIKSKIKNNYGKEIEERRRGNADF